MVRGLPMEPVPSLSERTRALRYFINNLAPGIRAAWIRYSNRAAVRDSMRDDIARIGLDDPVPAEAANSPTPRAVVLNSAGVLLGTIDKSDSAPHAREAMNSAPQTIRPDMTPQLAAKLLQSNRYLIVTTDHGKYLGRYLSITPSPEMSR
jgi:hypothetical protein